MKFNLRMFVSEIISRMRDKHHEISLTVERSLTGFRISTFFVNTKQKNKSNLK